MTPIHLVRTALAGGRRMTVVELCAATGISDSGIYRAIAAMGDELKSVTLPTNGRPSKVFALRRGEKRSPLTPADKIAAVLRHGTHATVAEIAAKARMGCAAVNTALKRDRRFVIVGERASVSGRRGGNRAAAVWGLVTTAPEVKRAPASQLGPEGPGCGEIRDSEGVETDHHDYGSGVTSIIFIASPAETDCPTLGRVVLAACIDGYVTDTARRKGPCDSCAIGRARRAAWAGADFEDELDADDSDSLDLR